MPKTKMERGIAVTSNTGWDNFGALLTGFLQGQLALHKEKVEANIRADEAEQQQAEFRTVLAKVADSNPDLYNSLVDDPSVRKFMDVGKPAEIQKQAPGSLFDQFMEKRRKSATQGTPQTGVNLPKIAEDSPTMQSYRLGQQAEASKAVSTIKTADLQGAIADYRSGKLSADDVVQQLIGLTGQAPSVADVAVAGGKVSPEEASATVPGTLAWKRTQADALSGELTGKYAVKNPSDVQRVRALAEYQMGLRDTPPEKLPPSFAQLELDLNTKSYQLRAAQFGFDKAQYATTQREHVMNTAFELTRYNVDPNVAIQAADTFLKTGKLPPGVTLSPDRRQELETKLDEVRLQKAEQDLQAAVVSDPEMESIVKSISLLPPDQRVGSPFWTRMTDKMKAQFGWQVEKGSFWEKTLYNFTNKWMSKPMGKPAERIVTEGFQETPRPSKTAAVMTPELVNAGNTVATQAMQVYTSLTPADKQAIRPLMSALADAQSNGDVAGTAKAIQDLQDALKVLQVR